MFKEFIDETVYIFNEAAIYILFGFIIAGLLKIALPTEKVFQYLGKKKTSSVVWASLLGIPIPLCSCAVLPTAISLKKQGASKGATLSFLISTPETGIDSISITYALIDPIMTIFRPISALVTALTAGITANYIERKTLEDDRPPVKEEVSACCDESCSCECSEIHSGGKFRQFMRYTFVDLLDDIVFWLILGIIVAGLISTTVPDNFFQSYIGSGLTSMIIMLIVSIPIYMCAASSTPIAAALILKGLNPGAALVFLLAGPATNIGTIAAVGKFLGKKIMIIYLGTIVSGSILLGFILNALYSALDIIPAAIIGSAAELLPTYLKLAGSIVLLLLIIRNLWHTGFKKALISLNGKLYDFTGFRITIWKK